VSSKNNYLIYVLGVAQDGGYPHLGCTKKCCQMAWEDTKLHKFPTSIALINKKEKKYWLFDVTPKIKEQMHLMNQFQCNLSGVFITHAHYGHYIGLLEFGLEVLNTKNIPVYVMPRMYNFLSGSLPFKLLVDNNNINLNKIDLAKIIINEDIDVQAFEVPHRNEISETVGFKISTSNKSVIYLPDIDNFKGYELKIKKMIINSDVAFIDGTFYKKSELDYRNINEVSHPEIASSMKLFFDLKKTDKKKIHFIHLNHTNPVLNSKTKEFKSIIDNGFSISSQNQIINF